MSEDNKKPSFYEIAAKIVKFCDEMSLTADERETDGGVRDNDDKRGLEI